jgi:hypothetical protein
MEWQMLYARRIRLILRGLFRFAVGQKDGALAKREESRG